MTALPMPDTELKLIAATAIMGEIKTCRYLSGMASIA